MRTVVVEGKIIDGYAQVVSDPLFEKIVREYMEETEVSESVRKIFEMGRSDFKYRRVVELLYSLTFEVFRGNEVERRELKKFVEGLYDFWRRKHRFMVRREKYSKSLKAKNDAMKAAQFVGGTFEKAIRGLYRSILANVSMSVEKVIRQISSGSQAIFITDKPRSRKRERMHSWMYSLPFIWSVVYDPPVIFYTKSNKRKGVFPVVKRKILDTLELGKGWYSLPLKVGNLTIFVYVNEEYLCHAAGLANLYEIADLDEVGKPDGVVIFGLSDAEITDKYRNGVVFEDDVYVGVIPALDENDYFGYAKKVLLTVHNLVMIDRGKLPIHGSLARIKLRNGKSVNVMFMGDSGAGKSETLDALGRLTEISGLRVIVDDMASLSIEGGKVVAYGTETGAFVRLDDLPPGYAYANIDRSLFMNPDQTNARVIVPYGNFDEITRPTPVDFFFYANNYEKVEDEDRIHFFDNPQSALEVLSKGARMAKGTTAEKGMSYSYFANPFGAIQRREIHEKIAKRYVEKMFETGVKVGEIRTMLGISGYEKDGPCLAAKRLLEVLSEMV